MLYRFLLSVGLEVDRGWRMIWCARVVWRSHRIGDFATVYRSVSR